MNAPLVQDELQQLAIRLCCSTDARIVSVTGQAGTGKTTIMKTVYHAFTDAGHNVVLAAPTGKAAKRIQEATGIPAMTIHRLLEFSHPGDPDEKTGKPIGISMPKRGPYHPLPYTVILVDEYSMVTTNLNRQLIDAMRTGSMLRAFGDANQLPPIEDFVVSSAPLPEDSPFKKFLKRFPAVKLKNIYRQGEGSDVVFNAHRILNKMCPQERGDFKLILGTDQQPSLLRLVEDEPEEFRSLAYQVITPTHRGWIGTRDLNNKMQQIIQGHNMSRAHVIPRDKWDKTELSLVEGDKILWTKNDYVLEIFNGETGHVVAFEDGQVVIDFGDRTISVPPIIKYEKPDGTHAAYDPRKCIRLAYAITTHASQGSEYDSVVYMMDKYSMVLQDQSNFYTGVTRAKRRATVIADRWSFQKAVITSRALI